MARLDFRQRVTAGQEAVPPDPGYLKLRQGRLSADETLEIALTLTTALEHLHSHGLVHRDIKPSNIIFVHGIPKLAGIGLVTSANATRSFVGTEEFLPPEGPGTARADVYSLGKVLYELCTGQERKDYPELPTLRDELDDRERLLELNAIIAKAERNLELAQENQDLADTSQREAAESREQKLPDRLILTNGCSGPRPVRTRQHRVRRQRVSMP